MNPITKAPLVIYGYEAHLMANKLIDHQDDGPTVHDEGSLPRTPEDTHRRLSRQTSVMQIVWSQLMMI